MMADNWNDGELELLGPFKQLEPDRQIGIYDPPPKKYKKKPVFQVHDSAKLYRNYKCKKCDKITEHIYCRSIHSQNMVYACMECCHERGSKQTEKYTSKTRQKKKEMIE